MQSNIDLCFILNHMIEYNRDANDSFIIQSLFIISLTKIDIDMSNIIE